MKRRRWLGCAAAICLLPACGDKRAANRPAVATAVTTASPMMPRNEADSSAFYYELGSLYERYRDPTLARQSFARAIEKAQSPEQSLQAELGLARVDEARGDTGGAIAQLEKALAERPNVSSGARLGPMGAEDAADRLGRLYVGSARYADAERLYQSLLAGNPAPPRRDSVLRAQVELYRKMGALDQRIADKKSATDESSLRFLAIAYGAGDLMIPRPATPGAPQPPLDELVRIYERLRELRPNDSQLRQMLIGLYERAKRTDDALALVRTTPVEETIFGAPGACPGVIPPRLEGAVATASESIRLLARAGRRDQALAETAKLVARSSDPSVGLRAVIAGAQLYAEANLPELATAALVKGLKTARTVEDKRALEITQAELLGRAGKSAELRALYARWKQSADLCLGAEATRRDSMLAQLPSPPPTRAMR